MQLIKFVNSKGNEIEFTNSAPTLLVEVEGMSGIEASEVSYAGYMQDGEAYQHSTLDKRQIVIKFHLMAIEVNELLKLRSVVNKVFNPKLGNGTLYYSYQGVQRKIVCVPDGTPVMPLRGGATDCEGEIILLAHEPYWLDIDETRIDIAVWKDAFSFPLIIPKKGIAMGYKEPSLIGNVCNSGDVECGMTIEFAAKGTVENPSLLNIDTGQYIKIKKTMVAGEKIIVNTRYNNKRVISEVATIQTNIMNYLDLDSTFLQLDVGDNLFRYNAESNLNQLEVSIKYTQRYLGV